LEIISNTELSLQLLEGAKVLENKWDLEYCLKYPTISFLAAVKPQRLLPTPFQ
jgi:hypothetical protein